MPSWKELTIFILRLGVGSSMLIAGTALMIIGVVKNLTWPFYVICGSIIIFAGLLAVCLDIFKDLRTQTIEIRKVKLQTEQAKNYDAYKEVVTKQTLQENQKLKQQMKE